MRNIFTILFAVFCFSANAQYWKDSHTGIIQTGIAGQTIPNNRFCYIKQSDSKLYLADPTDKGKQAVGLVVLGGSSGDTIQVFYTGQHYWPSGQIKAGTTYYLDTSGTITRVRPVHPIQAVAIGIFDSLISIDAREMYAGVIDTSATLDFGSTVSSSASNLTMAATGAEVGDYVILTVPAASEIDEGVFKARVTASNTVTISFLNLDPSSSRNPASGVFKIQVRKRL